MTENIEKAWDSFRCDIRINYIRVYGRGPSEEEIEKYKEIFTNTENQL